MLRGECLQTGDILGLAAFCMSCGASQPLRNTFADTAAHWGANTIVHNPIERTAAHFSKNKNIKRGQNVILKPEGPMS